MTGTTEAGQPGEASEIVDLDCLPPLPPELDRPDWSAKDPAAPAPSAGWRPWSLFTEADVIWADD